MFQSNLAPDFSLRFPALEISENYINCRCADCPCIVAPTAASPQLIKNDLGQITDFQPHQPYSPSSCDLCIQYFDKK